LVQHEIRNGPLSSQPKKDRQTVDVEWRSVDERIEGVFVKQLATLPDHRGTVCEIYRPEWGIHPDPLVFVYQITIRPGQIKGWQMHREQDDRLFVSSGTVQVVLYDDREGSPTSGMVNELFFGDHNRALFVIPAGIYHAIKNVDPTKDAVLVNVPTRPYDHENPDKYRLPLKNDLIPYTWR
jgi:dTDP-4-dehydrorhamnose 3,5-epimerase